MGIQTNRQELPSVLKLTWPIFIELLLAMLIGNIDTLMLSNYSQTAVGAIGNANQILYLLTLLFNIMASASGVVVAQYLGARRKDKINEIYSVSMFFNLFISLIISAFILLFSPMIFSIMQVNESLLQEALHYIYILGGFIFLQACFNTISQIFRSNGKTQYGMYISIIMNVLNIFGNYCFLYGPLKHYNLGVSGVAISSVVSRLIGLLIMMYLFHKKIDGHISITYLRPFPKDTLKKLVFIGTTSAGENISYSISQIIIMSFVNSIGVVAVNTKIYTSLLCSFSWLYSNSIASATQIVVGHAIGAKKEDAAYHRVLKSLKSAILISLLIAFINYALSPYTLSFFTTDPKVIALGTSIMMINIILEFGRATNLVIITSLRASGDIKFPTVLGMCSMWGISVLFSYIFGISAGLGLIGVWIAMSADECFRGIVVYIRWIKGYWRGKSVVSD